jgi:hypothetical protein
MLTLVGLGFDLGLQSCGDSTVSSGSGSRGGSGHEAPFLDASLMVSRHSSKWSVRFDIYKELSSI